MEHDERRADDLAGSSAFFLMIRRALWIAFIAWLSCAEPSPAAAADTTSGYRLAGTVALGREFIAFLELPSGSQVLVRNGETVGTARVLAIHDRAIELVLPTGRVELSLDGSARHVAPVPARDVVTSDLSQDHVLRREVDPQALTQALAATPQAAGDPGSAMARSFAPVLNLPAQGKVMDVNGEQVGSADSAIRTIERTLASGGAVYMNLETPNGMHRVYLMPQQQGSDATTPSSP